MIMVAANVSFFGVGQIEAHDMSYSLNSLKGVIEGIKIGEYDRGY